MLAFAQVLSLVVVPHTFAEINPSLVIYQLQTGATNALTEEFISVYNNTVLPVDVTGWCVTYSSSTDITHKPLGCVVAPEPDIRVMLPGHSSLLMASKEFVLTHSDFVPDIVFEAGIAGASGHIRLLNNAKEETDRLGWGSAVKPEGTAATAHASGKILQRAPGTVDGLTDTDNNSADFTHTTLANLPASSLYEEQVPVDICPNITDLQTEMPDGYLADNAGNCQPDACANIDGLQQDLPDGHQRAGGSLCELIPLEHAALIINELLPNPDSYDTGNEFIEIYNPNERPISLYGYILQVSPNFTKSYSFPTGQIILPGSYRSFADSDTGLVLPNSTASLQLLAPNGAIVSTSGTYASPNENMAWALIGQTWQYTNQPTPGRANAASLEEPEPVRDEEIVSLASCSAGQYRNTDTNRCRLLTTVASALTACKVGQERNPDTNRCRSVITAAASQAPCGANQERNPETNRCRNIASRTGNLVPCPEGQERNPETNRCRKMVLSANTNGIAKVTDVASSSAGGEIRWWLAGTGIALAIGYAFYEWRRDIANLWHRRRITKPGSK